MKEGRYSKLGKFDAQVINQIVNLLYVDEISRENYKTAFLREFNNYSDVEKKKNEPENQGCVRELLGLNEIDLRSPHDLARWLKEHQHTKYQKQNVKREREEFLKFFNSFLY